MKKIAICGKGGTGKSVLTSLLAGSLAEEGLSVLVVDADESNPGLYRMLGFPQAPRELMELMGGRKKILGRSPGGEKKAPGRIRLEEIPAPFVAGKGNLRLASVGKITAAFEGCACPMAEALARFLRRLELREGEKVIVDMEAGVEHFGRGVEKYMDMLLILVEPSFESIALAGKIHLMAQASGVARSGAILNKVASPAVGKKLEGEMEKRSVPVIGAIPFDPQIAERCLEGRELLGTQARESARRIIKNILATEGTARQSRNQKLPPFVKRLCRNVIARESASGGRPWPRRGDACVAPTKDLRLPRSPAKRGRSQ